MRSRPAGLAVALAVQARAMARAVTARRAAVDDQRAQADRGRGGRGEKGQPREGGHWGSEPSAKLATFGSWNAQREKACALPSEETGTEYGY